MVRSIKRPQRLGTLIPTISKRLFHSQGFTEAKVLLDWDHIVGSNISRFTCPQKLDRRGTLQVHVAGAFGLELQHLEPVVVERINGYFGHHAVKRLFLIQAPVIPHNERAVSTSRPLDKEKKKRLRHLLKDTTDPKLNEALEQMGRAILNRSDAGSKRID